MTKKEFLEELEELLIDADEDNKENSITYYDEMIEDFKENGLTEEEAIRKIGEPKDIVKSILGEESIVYKEVSGKLKILIMVLLILGLPIWGSLLFALVALILGVLMIILCGYVVIWCVPFMVGTFSLGSLVFGVISMIGSFVLMGQNLELGIFQLGFGISSMGLFIALAILTFKISKYFIKATKWFSKWLKEKTKNVFEVKICRI